MPAPNDLSPEEEALFGAHGVEPAGQGREPVADEPGEQQPPAPVVEEPAAEPPAAHGDRTPEPTVVVSRHREDGTFKTKEEFEQDMAAALAEQNAQTGEPAPSAQPGQPAAEQKMVPLQALHEARQRASQAAAQAQLLSTRMNAILAKQQQAPQQPQMPDLVQDPAAYIQALEQRLSAFEQQRQEETQYRELDNAINQDEELFAMNVPDYQQASDHYVQSRARELLALHTPEEAQQIMLREARMLATQSWERGISLGQMVYSLAQARGYTPGNTAADPTRAPIPPRPQAQQPQAQPQQPNGRPNAAAVVASVTNGQQVSRSLSGGGSGGTAELNAEAVLNMSDEEFEAHFGLGTKGANARFASVG
jgi:hypothetical protein